MTEVDWDAQELNQARIDLLQQFEDTRFHERGIIAIDDVLIARSGKCIKDSGTFWDHPEQRYKYARDLIIVNYVHPYSKKHYPFEFRRYKKAGQCEWTGEQFKKMTELTIELIRLCHDNGVPGTFTFDSFYTCYEIQNDINALQNADGTPRGYVGDLKFNRKITFKGVKQKTSEFASTILPEDRKPVTVDGVKQWYLTVCVKLTTIGENCHALLRKSIQTMIGRVAEQIESVAQTGGNVPRRLTGTLRRPGTITQQ